MPDHNGRPKLSSRQETILNLVDQRGFVATEDMVEHFGVTPQTVRRDINMLCELGMLQRFHGGAGRQLSAENAPYLDRLQAGSKAKRDIAQLAASQIPNGASLFVNIGTTTEAVALALGGHRDLSIVTNNINVANILRANETFRIMVAGGHVRQSDGGIVGEATTAFVNQFRLDIGVIGVSGIDTDGALLDFDYQETLTARAIIDNSRTVFLVTDHSKFGRHAMTSFGDLSDIDHLFTDRTPPEQFAKALDAANVVTHIVSPQD